MSSYKRFLLGTIMLGTLSWGLVACGSDETVLSIATAAPTLIPPTATIILPTPTSPPTAPPVKITTAPATATPVPTLSPTTTSRPASNTPTLAAPTGATPALTAASQGLKITTRNNYYEIAGATADELRVQLDKLGPLDESGQHFAAKTDGNLSWSWSYTEGGGKCTLHDISAQLDIIFTLPRWTAPAGATAELVDKWDKFTAALQVHENGHKDINIAVVNEFMVAVKALPSYATCDELKQALNQAGQDVVTETRQQNVAYDASTQHGRTQGAIFP